MASSWKTRPDQAVEAGSDPRGLHCSGTILFLSFPDPHGICHRIDPYFCWAPFRALLSNPLLRQQVGLIRWLAVCMGFAGIVLVIRPEGDVFSWYALLPVCAAFCYASNSVTAPLFEESISTPLLNLYTLAGALTGSAVFVAVSGGLVEVVSVRDWIWLASMGFFGAAGVFCMVSAYRLTEPSNLFPFEYFGIPFSFMLGWLFFAETPFSRLIPGVFLIIGGGFLIIWRKRSGKSILN